MNPTTLHTDAQTVTLAIIAVVLPFAALVINKKMWTKRAAILGLFLSVVMINSAAVAQGNAEPATPMPNTPLIIVDRTYLADDFSAIKPSDVIKVDTVNGAKAAAIFGARGVNGVFLITTKKGKPGTKYAEQFMPYLSKVKYRSWVALNTKLADSGLAGLNTNDIIKLEFSKKGTKSGKFTSDGHSLLLIVTKAYAINQYLNKICSVTTGFRTYLVNHNYDDSNVIYNVDGKFRHKNHIEDIKALYDLPVEKIKFAFFLTDQVDKNWHYQEVIVKTTTDKN